MKLGPEPLASDERVEGPAPARLPFLDVAEALAAAGVPVPAVLADRSDAGLVVLEDLGDETFEDHLAQLPREQWGRAYGRAIAVLVDLHAAEAAVRARGSIAAARRYGPELLAWELEHFREWGLEARGIQLSAAATRTVAVAFERIVGRLDSCPYGLSHRDYQSRNLMVTPGGLRVIDFQDALLAPVVYDLVALLRDSYVQLTEDEVGAALATYLESRAARGLAPLDRDRFRDDFRWMTVQRKLKDAGRFVFIERVKGDPSFLRHIPASLEHVRRALEGLPELTDLNAVLHDHLPEWRG